MQAIVDTLLATTDFRQQQKINERHLAIQSSMHRTRVGLGSGLWLRNGDRARNEEAMIRNQKSRQGELSEVSSQQTWSLQAEDKKSASPTKNLNSYSLDRQTPKMP